MTRLEEHYAKEVVANLKKEFKYSSAMQVPKLTRIVLNMGLGEAIGNQKIIEYAEEAMTKLSGQKSVVTKSKKSIASFKLRKGLPIGCMVTLRGKRMFEFLDRFISVALPRVRDFKGVPTKGFDGRGNFTMGLKEQSIFPEVEIDKVDKDRGMNITFVTSAVTDAEGKALLAHMGIPFVKKVVTVQQ
ncbi:MAG: 50S ribosomal protein L5 [bacterium]|nr:50S ribosomal protein L5 [bacterium]